jgi:hypothetical protein
MTLMRAAIGTDDTDLMRAVEMIWNFFGDVGNIKMILFFDKQRHVLTQVVVVVLY